MCALHRNIKTSVVIPVYNTKEYLKACVESVLRQTQKEIEIILIDDGSTDGSTQIIEEYEKSNFQIKAIYQGNQKQGAARNAGIKICSGRYIYFLDSDDYISENLLEKCYQEAEDGHLDFLMFDEIAFRDGESDEVQILAEKEQYNRGNTCIEEKIFTGVEFWNRYFSKGGIYSNSCLLYINAEFLKKNDLFYEPEIYYEDNDWILRMYLNAERVSYKPWQLHYRRFRAGSTMTIDYNDIHYRSSIFEYRKMSQMFLEEKDDLRRKIIFSMSKIMLSRFKEIMEYFYRESRLKGIRRETLEFYQYLLKFYPQIPMQNERIEFISIIQVMHVRLQELGLPTGTSELELQKEKKKILLQEFEKYPLSREDMTVGIYGTGMICDKFLSLYHQMVGTLAANIFFVDTYKESGENYQGYPLYNLKDMDKIKADCIIIASIRYGREMQKNIQMYFRGKVQILFMTELLRYF